MEKRMDYYREKVFRFIARFIKNQDLLEIFTQEVMMKAWGNRKRISQQSDPATNIFKLPNNNVLDHFKKLAREKEYQEEVWYYMQNRVPGVESNMVQNEINERLDAVIKTLPPRQQEIYTLTIRKGLSLEEIAATLDIAPRTARN